jgi:hypothetical protein
MPFDEYYLEIEKRGYVLYSTYENQHSSPMYGTRELLTRKHIYENAFQW